MKNNVGKYMHVLNSKNVYFGNNISRLPDWKPSFI